MGYVQLRVLAQVEAVRAYRLRGVHPHQEVEQGRGRARATALHEQGPTLLQVLGQMRTRRCEAVLHPNGKPPNGPHPTRQEWNYPYTQQVRRGGQSCPPRVE